MFKLPGVNSTRAIRQAWHSERCHTSRDQTMRGDAITAPALSRPTHECAIKITPRSSAGNAAGPYQVSIPHVLRKREVEGAPGAHTQVGEALGREVLGDRAPQTVEAHNANRTRNRLPLVGRSAEWECTERFCREPQTVRTISAQSTARRPGRTTHLLIHRPRDVVDRLRCVLSGSMMRDQRAVCRRCHGRETHRNRCTERRLRWKCCPTLSCIRPDPLEDRGAIPSVPLRKDRLHGRVDQRTKDAHVRLKRWETLDKGEANTRPHTSSYRLVAFPVRGLAGRQLAEEEQLGDRVLETPAESTRIGDALHELSRDDRLCLILETKIRCKGEGERLGGRERFGLQQQIARKRKP